MGKRMGELETRMRTYEAVTKATLTKRVPAIIRVDGRSFHRFTRGFDKPFDEVLMRAMQDTMLQLCKGIEGCKLAYTQSDEITLVLTDYETVKTGSWFDYEVEKMVSISASMATLFFNRAFAARVDVYKSKLTEEEAQTDARLATYNRALTQGAMFDSRVFNVPKDDVCNNLIFRQQDATRNSIEMVGHVYFSQKTLDKVNTNQIQDMLYKEHGINWNDYPVDCKRGSCAYRKHKVETIPNPRNPSEMITVERNPWIVDREPPIFTQDRNYIERFL